MSFARRVLVVVLVIQVLVIVREILFTVGLERYVQGLGNFQPIPLIVTAILVGDVALLLPVSRGSRWATLATLPLMALLLLAVLPIWLTVFGSPSQENFAVWVTLTVGVVVSVVGIPIGILATMESFGRRRVEPASSAGFSTSSMFAVSIIGALVGMAFLAVAVAASPNSGDASFEAPPDEYASVVMSNLRFDPSELHVVANKTTAVFVSNEDGFDHSFDVDALDVHVMIPAHQTKVVMLELGAGANVELYCAIPGHRDSGMVGRVVSQ